MFKLILTGGGTAGHVTPNIALIDRMRAEGGFEISYIGSYDGIEKQLIGDTGVAYYGISSGKLRRYRNVKNLSDPFRVLKGCFQAYRLIRRLKPDGVFSKGGFVSVPVIVAARLCGVPSIIHESDMTPGLANKLAIPFATKVCVTFEETLKHLPKDKAVLTGSPIRSQVLEGDRAAGLKLCGFSADKPVVMMIGGSMGSVRINKVLREALPTLLEKYQLVHLCGKGNVDAALDGLADYRQFEYVKHELADLFAMADVVLSRAGSNAISELLALKKPNVLIPLSLEASRGDQILNAASFEKQGYSLVLPEDKMTVESLVAAVDRVYQDRAVYAASMAASAQTDGVSAVLSELKSLLKEKR